MRILIIITFLFIFTLKILHTEKCSKSASFDEEESIKSMYTESSNKIFKQIEDSLHSYTPCSNRSCECHLPIIERDLAQFSGGITKEMIDSVANKGTKYQIINKKLYRQKSCMFPLRCSGVEHFIKMLLKELPNMEFIINCRDWPQLYKNFVGTKGPVFSFSKTENELDIMYPAWSFWEGGPAISLYPTGIGRWDLHRKKITEIADEKYPWENKISKGFFRGSRTSDERDFLILLSRDQPNLVDAQYTKNQAWKSPKDTLNAEPAKEVSFEEHCQYKYLFNFRGVAASFRFKHLFLCKSLVFHIGDEWKEFFYDAMKPWVHYVPLNTNTKKEDLIELLEFFKEHDDVAKEIANRGFEFIWKHLRMQDVICYWRNLLIKYGNLIKYDVKLDDTLIEIS
ncbi:O-glucosyltransferase rumi homolog [Condylostylus longicornis]|uniref:O-glucosyltransferase rumi homolog n=1 Tax=Condylostylus longicornis TaxID=2530218 RepID=UPI00244E411B|nr:O-glucosyltransferase rumi homolog [Condylostylus longicornis]